MTYDHSRQAVENAARQAAQQRQQLADMQRHATQVRERAEAAYRQEVARQDRWRVEQSPPPKKSWWK